MEKETGRNRGNERRRIKNNRSTGPRKGMEVR
jgi:hypothetical protein